MTLRYAELFAGAGGMSLGLERAGLSCAFHAEIADFPRRVLKYRWPTVPLYGDVSQLNGRALVAAHGAIDLLAGGSPCQDLSVAGKRAGLGGARSGLFYQQLRVWEETGATYLLWENVAGALSSNSGADFAAVLSAIVGATVAVPRDGWGGDESGGGVAAGPRAVAAWRLLDAQHFGVPQRRLRVFVLGARVGGCDPAEVLLEPSGVRRHPPTRGEARKGSARGIGAGIGFQSSQSGVRSVDTFATLDANYGSRRHNGVLAIDLQQVTSKANRSQPQPLNGGGNVIAFGWQNSASQGDDCRNEADASLRVNTVPAVLAFHVVGDGSDAGAECRTTLRAQEHSYGGRPPCVLESVVCATGDVAHSLTHEGHDASEDGTGRGTPIIANCVTAREAKGWNPASAVGNGTISHGIPRRLMPVECERLMSWPPGWTDVPDENGKAAADSLRYKACGNGVVSNVAEWLGRRLIAVHDAMSASEPPARVGGEP